MQNSIDQNFINKLVNYLQTKQYKKLQLEVNLLGKVEDQNPIIIFYYAVSLSSYERVTKEDLFYASDLFEKVYLTNKSNLLPLHNMVRLSFTTKKFSKVKKYVEEEIGKNNNELNKIFVRVNANDSWDNFISYLQKDSRLGDSHMSVPGHDGKKGFGGACLPKDSIALLNFFKENDLDFKVLKSAIDVNNIIRDKYNDDPREREQRINFKKSIT